MTTQPAPLDTDPRPPGLCIGYPIWWMNVNRRIYAPKNPNEVYGKGGPIWREHWQFVRITGETPQLWIVHHGAARFRKSVAPGGRLPEGLAWTGRELDVKAWVNDNRHLIAAAMHKLDADELARIARLIGYKPEAPA